MAPLVGRELELAELTALLDDVETGIGRLALLAGEAGIGKTRLAEELAQRASARGFQVAWGRAWEGGGTPVFWPWTQVLRALATPARPAPGLATAPELPLERFELFDAVGRYCAEVARDKPVAIVLEDLHAADGATLALIDFLATQLRNLRVLVIGTYREAELRLRADAGQEVVRAARHGRTLPIGRLGRAELGTLARELGVVDADAADRVFRATDGHPFFACELLRTLRAHPADGVRIPDGVRAAVRERFALVSDGVRPILEAAAALGRDVAPAVLADITRDGPHAGSDAALAEAVRAGLLEQVADGYRFAHALIRDTIHDDLPPPRRAALHRTIAETLARRRGDDAPLTEIAHHYLAAGPDCLDAAVHAACAAAERCIRQLAFEDALALVERASAAVEVATSRSATAESAGGSAGLAGAALTQRAELLLVAGTARLRAGDDAGGRRACDDAAALARRLGSAELLARAALAYGSVLRPARVDPLLVGMLEEALAALPPGGPRALVEARLAGALQPAFDPTVPIGMARRAIASARTLDANSRLAVLVSAGAALQDVGDPTERAELDRETLALATERGDLAVTIRAHQRLAFDQLSLGETEAADREIATLHQLVAGLPVRWRWPVAMLRAMRALGEARFDDVASEVAHARELLGLHADATLDRCLRLRAYFETLLREQDDELADRWRDAAPLFHQRPLPDLCVALVHVRAGRIDDARVALAACPRDAVIAFAADPPTSILVAEVLAATSDRELAEAVAPRIAPLAGRIACWSWLAMTCLGPTERALGLIAQTRGQLAEAERWFAIAEERAEHAALWLHLPRLQYERGVTALAAGDRARGLLHLGRAATGAERIGLPGLSARIARTRNAATVATRAADTEAPLVVELVREGELWLVRGGSDSCRLKDGRGVRMLARLVESPERELHVLVLGSDGGEAIDAGDAGELLDPTARAAYRRRIGELRAAVDDAEAAHDLGRAERARAELEHLEAELTAAVGLGGRNRRAASAAERARINVQRRLAGAIERIALAAPALGHHLDQCIRTGVYCRYSPANPRRS